MDGAEAMTGSEAMENAAERICLILDTLSPADAGALIIRLVMITAMKAEDTEDYITWLPEIITDAIREHLTSLESPPSQGVN
jgi:hypothetical protein